MSHIVSYSFTPISNNQQQLHVITIGERLQKGGASLLLPHRTDFYIIHLVSQGSSKHMVDFIETDLQRGDVLLISPGQVHHFIENENYDGYLVAFPKEFFYHSPQDKYFLENAQIFNTINPFTKIHFNESELNEIIALIEKIKNELLTMYDDFQRSVLHNYLSNLLLFSERKFKTKNNSKDQYNFNSADTLHVTKFKKLIIKNFRTETKVAYYAKELFISERTLQKAVMAVLGKSPKKLINEQIILESKRLLIHGTMSIKEVSYDIGFDEPTNFTNFFKSHTGLSPKQFRQEKLLKLP